MTLPFQDLFFSLDTGIKDSMFGIIDTTFLRLIQPVEHTEAVLSHPVKEIIAQIEHLNEAMMVYKLSTEMEADFFV